MVGTEMETSSRNKKAMPQKMGVRRANLAMVRGDRTMRPHCSIYRKSIVTAGNVLDGNAIVRSSAVVL